MPTTASKPKMNYEAAPQGTHLARCVGFIHIGIIDGEYEGKPIKTDKCQLAFELPTKTKVYKEENSPQPIIVNQEYTLSMGPKAKLRPIVEGMIGTSLLDQEAYNFDVESLVGMPCLITIKHKTSKAGNLRAEIASVGPLMEGQTCPPQVNVSRVLSYGSWNNELFESLPEFLKEKIRSSEQYGKKFRSTLTDDQRQDIIETKAQIRKAEVEFNSIPDDDINPEDIVM